MKRDIEASIVDLTQRLVRLPSRAGIDDYLPVFSLLRGWLEERGISCLLLEADAGRPIVLIAEVQGASTGAEYWLNATVDTAGFGDPRAWSASPTSGHIEGGWLHGRGSADSKAGIAIFCHVAAAWQERRNRLCGTIKLVFDGDEHNGSFAGIRRALVDMARGARGGPSGVLLGYPGLERIGIGGRGFERAIISVYGQAAHSGSSTRHGINAVCAAARLVVALDQARLPSPPAQSDFPLPPSLTVTSIGGGHGFSEVPDLCQVQVDMRLTPDFDRLRARRFLENAVLGAQLPGTGGARSAIAWVPGWPAYRLAPGSRLVLALSLSAREVLGREVPPEVVGPSNVANLLHAEGIEATCGFGVAYRNLHATDEGVDVSTFEKVYHVYFRTMEKLLAPP